MVLVALCLYDLATLRSPIQSDFHKRYRFPDPGMPPLVQGGSIFFPVFCHLSSLETPYSYPLGSEASICPPPITEYAITTWHLPELSVPPTVDNSTPSFFSLHSCCHCGRDNPAHIDECFVLTFPSIFELLLRPKYPPKYPLSQSYWTKFLW